MTTAIQLPPFPRTGDPKEVARWQLLVLDAIRRSGGIGWSSLDFSASNHQDIGNVLGSDDTSSDATKNKHVSNAQMKANTDHRNDTTIHHKPAAATADAVASTVSVVGGPAGAIYGATEQALLNELKGDVNQLVSDANAAIVQLNLLMANLRAVGTLDT